MSDEPKTLFGFPVVIRDDIAPGEIRFGDFGVEYGELMKKEIFVGDRHIPAGVRIEASKEFSPAELGKRLMRMVAETLPPTRENFGGHINWHCDTDEATVSAHVSIWREVCPSCGQPLVFDKETRRTKHKAPACEQWRAA